MKAAFQTFSAGVTELINFLDSSEKESELISLLLDPARQAALNERELILLSAIGRATTDRKRYIYCVAVVSLYGLLERFVDSLIEAYVQQIAKLAPSYSDLPDAIRNKHLTLSVDLLRALVDERHREELLPGTVIANLKSCEGGESNFRLNGAAFVLHRGNINLGKIAGFLGSVGVDGHNRRVLRSPALTGYFSRTTPERNLDAISDPEIPALLSGIDDLVERRNQISHGVLSVDEIESTALLRDRCDFVATYCESLLHVMRIGVVNYQIACPSTERLGKAIAIYNNSIVCFETTATKVRVGDILVASTGEAMEPIRFGPIESLEVNKKRVAEIVTGSPTKYGVKVPFYANDRFEYYLLAGGDFDL